jgi:GTPase SAR1 family protein
MNFGDIAQSCDPIETIDLQTTADYIKQCLKRSKIRFALLGRSAAGKSTFINRFRYPLFVFVPLTIHRLQSELIRKTIKYSCMMIIWPFSEIWID